MTAEFRPCRGRSGTSGRTLRKTNDFDIRSCAGWGTMFTAALLVAGDAHYESSRRRGVPHDAARPKPLGPPAEDSLARRRDPRAPAAVVAGLRAALQRAALTLRSVATHGVNPYEIAAGPRSGHTRMPCLSGGELPARRVAVWPAGGRDRQAGGQHRAERSAPRRHPQARGGATRAVTRQPRRRLVSRALGSAG